MQNQGTAVLLDLLKMSCGPLRVIEIFWRQDNYKGGGMGAFGLLDKIQKYQRHLKNKRSRVCGVFVTLVID